MKYILSDTHLFHDKVMAHRHEYKTVDEMSQAIIDMWIDTIKPDDRVYHLGDFAFGDDFELIENVVKILPGRVTLIAGNHDTPKKLALYSKYWKVASAVFIDGIVLSHAPLHPYLFTDSKNRTDENSKAFACIHGHIHTAVLNDKRYFNANWDVLVGPKILRLSDIKETLKKEML